MTPASTSGRRRWASWAVVLLGATACGDPAPSAAPVTVWSTPAAVVDAGAPAAVSAGEIEDSTPLPTTTTAVASTAVASPLAALVADLGSAVYQPQSEQAAAVPIGISIPDLDVGDAPVAPVGVLDNGDLDVPDPEVVGWYRYGPAPADEGSTVLAAHVNFNGEPGVFRYLRDLEPGARVDVRLSDDSVRSYVITELRLTDKDDLEELGVWRRTGPSTLTLVTCGGRFNEDRRRYEDNVIAFAAPV